MRLTTSLQDKDNKDTHTLLKMRKYYQLTLALVCLVSVIFLLFYRHEYYRLRYVLEVLNFFGKPGADIAQPNICLPVNSTLGINLQEKSKLLFTFPLPVWQRLTNSHYVYSAFWEFSDKDRRVKALSFGINEHEPDLALGCNLWYDTHVEPVAAQFSFSKKLKDRATKAKDPEVMRSMFSYDLYCRPTARDIEGIPYGVTFYKTSDTLRATVYIPVHSSRPTHSNITTICIAPTLKHNLQKSTMIEFLAYHQIIGASEFIVYDSGPMSRIMSMLTEYSIHDKLEFAISTVPWNFPFPEAYSFGSSVIQQDCILRSKGKTRSVAILDWDKYIVPKFHNSLPAMLDDLGKTASLFKVMVATFCTQVPDTFTASDSHLLSDTNFILEPELTTNIFQPGQTSGRTQRILPGIALVHRYAQCLEHELSVAQTNTDTSMLRFSNDLSKSRLLNAWHSGKFKYA